jgi:hypothetical protein
MATYKPRKSSLTYCLHCKKREVDPTVSMETCTRCFKDIDSSVQLLATRKARCGHVSFNYYDCVECKDAKKADRNEWWGIVKKIAAWDIESMSYNKPKRKPGHALRNVMPALEKARGYTYNKRSNTYQVRFKTKHIGTTRTPEAAREMYLKRVEEYRNEVTANAKSACNDGHEVSKPEVLQPAGKALHDAN